MTAITGSPAIQLPRTFPVLRDSINRRAIASHSDLLSTGKSYSERSMQLDSICRHFSAEERHDIAESALGEIVPRVYGEAKSSIKRVMRDARCGERTARNLLAGAIPSTRILWSMARHNADVRAALVRALGYSPEAVRRADTRLDAVMDKITALESQIRELRR